MTPDSDAGTVLIVGAGQAGGQVARHLRSGGYPGRILLAGDEPHLPYERPPLSKAVLKDAGAEADLHLCPEAEWQALELRLADPVVAIDTGARRACFASGSELEYDHLVLATGGSPRRLPLPGGEGCAALRTLEDSRTLRAALARSGSIAIIGGGVIGMEVAATAAMAGKRATVIEAGSRVMARILPPVVSDWLSALHRAAGVEIITHARIDRVDTAGGGFAITGPGLKVQADIGLVAVGVSPNVALLPDAEIGAAGGIVTDACGRIPRLPGCFALGDVAESWNALYGRPLRLETWRNADRQARAVAATICGTDTPHTEIPWMWTDQLGRNIQVVGLWSEGAEVIARGEVGAPGTVVFWLRDGVIEGGVLIDHGRDRRFLEKLVETRARPAPDALADPKTPLKSLC